MAGIDVLYNDLLVHLPGAPLPLVDENIINAARIFCMRSGALVKELPAISTIDNESTYAIPVPAGHDFVRAVSVRLDGVHLSQAPASDIDKYADKYGTPIKYAHRTTDSITIIPAPYSGSNNALRIAAALMPAKGATSIDDWLLNRYRNILVYGTLAHLMLIPNKAWTNVELAAVYAKLFDDGIIYATNEASNGFTKHRPRFSGKFI